MNALQCAVPRCSTVIEFGANHQFQVQHSNASSWVQLVLEEGE
jgi:hypothetical protein